MFDARLLKRVASCLAAAALALLLSPSAHGQLINLSLNVYYDIPSDLNSGGNWKLVAKSTDFGIVGVNVGLIGINPGVVNEAPRGIVNGSELAGFGTFGLFAGSYLVTQVPVFPTGTEEESAFYGVGTMMNGDPDGVGTPYADGTFTMLEDVPWALGDDLVAGPSIWDTAATLLSGTFADNAQPTFGPGTNGRVFMTIGTSTTYGEADIAAITTTIRSNFVPGTGGPDYNQDGVVDAADYVAWRKLPGTFGGDPAGYNLWRENFSELVTPGGSGQPSAAVPEPMSAMLLFFAVIYGVCTRAPRRQSPPAA